MSNAYHGTRAYEARTTVIFYSAATLLLGFAAGLTGAVLVIWLSFLS